MQFKSTSMHLAFHTGRFMLSLSQTTHPGNSSMAKLVSEQIQQSSDFCLSFWCSMNYRSEKITPHYVLDS